MIATTRSQRHERGLTLLEVLVSLAVISIISILMYGAFDSLSRGKKGEGIKTERARQARAAMLRIERELTSAFLSAHVPNDKSLIVRNTAFIAQNGFQTDRVDFASFSHIRVEADAKESDQCELGYFVVRNPDDSEKKDLVRREEFPIDIDPQKGGQVNVLVEDVESFDLRYLDATTGLWTESWDSTQVNSQPNRLPTEVQITLKLARVPPGVESVYVTKVMLPMREPLSFGFVR